MKTKNPTMFSPFPKRCGKWIKYQKELFKRYNHINACDIEGKMTPCNTRVYFSQQNLTGFEGVPLLISFIEKMGIEEDLESVFDHAGYIYLTTDLLLLVIFSTIFCSILKENCS